MGNAPLDAGDLSSKLGGDTIECGKEVLQHFSFDKDFVNLNHGSFGTYPRSIRAVLRDYQDQSEQRPDEFLRYTFPELLDESRRLVAEYLNAPVDACVFVPNATTAINTVLRNMAFEAQDVIVYFDTIYGSCEKTVVYLEESTPVKGRKIRCSYPVSDEVLCARFESTLKDLQSEGKRAVAAIFDTVTSLPGVRTPFERLTELCRKYKVMSIVDGAHGIGQIPIDLTALDPDFFFTNCHKWLFVPRGAAVFYVPERHQAMMRSTLPTSHGFVPRDSFGINNPLPPSNKSEFVTNFQFVGSLDSTPYLCVPAALQWRSRITYNGKRGEEAIYQYGHWLGRESGRIVSKILGTHVLENDEQSLGKCNFSNVQLPLKYDEDAQNDFATAIKIGVWISQTLKEYGTFMAIIFYENMWWVRLSATIYLTAEDFEWAGNVLRSVCDRARTGEWKN